MSISLFVYNPKYIIFACFGLKLCMATRMFHGFRICLIGEFWGLSIKKIPKAICRVQSTQFKVFYIIVKLIMPSLTLPLDDGKSLYTFKLLAFETRLSNMTIFVKQKVRSAVCCNCKC